MDKDLRHIKKRYGEKLAHICEELFPTLLDTPDLLPQILDRKFDKTSSLGEALSTEDLQQEFKDFVYSFVDVERPRPEMIETKDAFAMMAQAGYKLYPECLTEADIQSFRGFYYRQGPTPVYTGGKPEKRAGEEICTFNGGRLNRCRVWFAVKEGAENLRRIAFKNPTRDDAYGKSVISIQFARHGTPTLSIKNRYNHSVTNPDATFSNNLENIIPGLTQAWAETFSMNLTPNEKVSFSLDGFRLASDGKYYKKNCQDNAGLNFCENNVVIDNGQAIKLSTDFMLIDNHIFDLKNNRVITYQTYKAEHPEIVPNQPQQHNPWGLEQDQSFEDTAFISSLGKIKKIEVKKGEKKERIISVKTEAGEDVVITIGRHNEILDVHDPNSTEIEDGYLHLSKNLRSFSAPQAITIGNSVINRSTTLRELHLPKVEVIGNDFTNYTTIIRKLDMPKLREIGNNCFSSTLISEINLPNLETIGNSSFSCFNSVEIFARQFLEMLREDQQEELFLANPIGFFKTVSADAEQEERDMIRELSISSLTIFNAPKLREIGLGCFVENGIREFNAPNLQSVGQNSFSRTSIVSFNCGIPIEQGQQKTLTEEDQQLLSTCFDTIVSIQREMLGIKELEQGEEASVVTETIQPLNEDVSQTTQQETVLTGSSISSESTFKDLEKYHKETPGTVISTQPSQTDIVQE